MTGDPVRWLWATLALALWLMIVAAVAWTRARSRRAAAARAFALAPAETSDALLVAFASQTGQAEELAWMTASSLSEAGAASRVALLGDLDPVELKAEGRILIIASTTGEGDGPDAMSWFARKHMIAPADLAGLSYALLALGDRTYADFCGFGRALDLWLKRSGATPLFDRVEVDNGDAGAIRHWQHQLGVVTGHAVQADWTPPAFDRWRLADRTHLNPGSPGGEAWLLAFEPVDHAPDWVAGDIAEIGLPGDRSPGSREYSVASLPADGRVEFIVRLMARPDGSPGLASGWLTRGLAIGDAVGMRIRTNRGFHGPAPETPLILIGNGTGLAGLRAHWRARAGQPHGGVWLMFGERTSAHDAFLDAEIRAAVSAGVLTRLDRAFSRDPGDGRYVQALIAQNTDDLISWVERGAVVLVCGSLEGMSQGVQAALETALGPDRLLALTEAGRYRRDVY
ncbi:sulfite reductase subunit alpha [Roseibacterium beibuensis]|uniref:sulfite reductase subunit alpha n=1 Tax=[Roseibacterium] beibuensis TaxID=1193142 RepID=UPI00217EE663|nr:sulfite reductase subunit alpha [Roseibacterium beibuensis]MCS6624461.1 sulfite reductase subunit alpha [Roseibacterium beibuensis]